MALQIEVENIDAVRRLLKRMPKRLCDQVRDAFRATVLDAQTTVISRMDTGGPSVRTGALRRSIRTKVTGANLNDLQASLYSAQGSGEQEVVYAPIHEYGGVIKAKKAYAGVPGGPYLNIPTTANQTASGVMRMSARDVFSSGGYVAPRGKNRWGVYMGDTLMFRLVKQVTIPARLKMVESVEDEIPTLLSRLKDMRL